MAQNTTESSSSQRETAFREMIRAYGLARRVMDPYFARYGISGSPWGVLRVLHRAEAANEPQLLLSELGRRLLVRPRASPARSTAWSGWAWRCVPPRRPTCAPRRSA